MRSSIIPSSFAFVPGIARRGAPLAPAALLPDAEGHGTAVLDAVDARSAIEARIDEINVRVSAILDEAEARAEGERGLTPEELTERTRLVGTRATLTARLDQLDAEEASRQRAAQRAQQTGGTGGGAVILSEPKTYDPGQGHSYWLDLARDKHNRGDGDGGVKAARDRLQRHAIELDVELRRRDEARARTANTQMDRMGERERWSEEQRANVFIKRAGVNGSRFGEELVRGNAADGAEIRVNPNRTDGQGGFFVPPLWQVDNYIDLPRFGRTAANLCAQFDLPGGTDSINVPKIATGTLTGVQSADAGAATSQDLTDTSVTAAVRTIDGQQDIAIQLLDQSPVAFDEIVFADLLADYNMRLDAQVLSGTGSAGQVLGILNAGGTTVTYTDATPTLPELWVPLLQSASKVAFLRKLAATGVLVDPRVWYWSLSQLDTATRPLLLGDGASAQNTMGTGDSLEADGPAGRFTYGLPAYLDGNLPSNLGAGTNESRIITARWQDLYLWEGAMRTRVLDQILSGTLQIRLQMYNYVAFMPNRRPEAIAVIGGTGLIPATGF